MNIQNELCYVEYLNRENEILHAPYNPELEFYLSVQSGNLIKVKELCRESLLDKKGLGKLSESYLQNIKYHFVITTAIIARYCIDGGLEQTEAFTISDFYIQKADKAKTPEAVASLHPQMCIEYTKRMRNLRKKKITSPHIVKALDYIYDHLHTKISTSILAEQTGLNPSYFSRLFKEETGLSVTEYIINKKIDTAKNMLIYSDYPISQISEILAYPSQSYFTEIFRKTTGMTPVTFRNKHIRQLGIKND